MLGGGGFWWVWGVGLGEWVVVVEGGWCVVIGGWRLVKSGWWWVFKPVKILDKGYFETALNFILWYV